MEYNALFVIFDKAAKFEIVVCCKLSVSLYGLKFIAFGIYILCIAFMNDFYCLFKL